MSPSKQNVVTHNIMLHHALPARYLDVAMITALEAVLGLAELYAFDSSSLHPRQHVFHLHPDHRQHEPTQHSIP